MKWARVACLAPGTPRLDWAKIPGMHTDAISPIIRA